MTAGRRPHAASALALLLALAGCGTSPPATGPMDTPAPSLDTPAPPARFTAGELAAIDQLRGEQAIAARQAQRDGRYRAAESAWSVVLALDPADTAAQAGLAEARRAAQDAAADSTRRADQARSRGDAEAAMRLYLEALAQDPSSAANAQALRALELERTRRSVMPNFAKPLRPPATGTANAPPELEHADLLVAEGEIDAALLLLEPLAREPRADASLKNRVCELLLRQAAPRPGQGDPPQAAALVQRCLKLVPQHAQALQRQKALRGNGR